MPVKSTVIKLIATALIHLWCSVVIKYSHGQDIPANHDLLSSNASVTVYNNTFYDNDAIIDHKGESISSPETQEEKTLNQEQNGKNPATGLFDKYTAKTKPSIVTSNDLQEDFTGIMTERVVKTLSDATTSSHINKTYFTESRHLPNQKNYSEDRENLIPESATDAQLSENDLSTVGDQRQPDSNDKETLTKSHSATEKTVVTVMYRSGAVTTETKDNQTYEITTHQASSLHHESSYKHHTDHHNSKTGHSGHHPIPFRHHLQLVPMEDEPFGAVILKDERYVVSVMIPIGVGIIGAAIIIATLYTLRYIARKNARSIHFPDLETARPHTSCISSISSERTDRVVLLGGDEDDDF